MSSRTNYDWDAIVAKVQDPARKPRPPAAEAPRPPAAVADRAPAAGSVDPYNWHRVVAEVMDPERRLTIGELDQRV